MGSLSRCASRCSARWNPRPWTPWTCPAASEPGVTATCEPSKPATPKTTTASPPWPPPSPPPSGLPQVSGIGCWYFCFYLQIDAKSSHLSNIEQLVQTGCIVKTASNLCMTHSCVFSLFLITLDYCSCANSSDCILDTVLHLLICGCIRE